jgi:hypothetical protein
VDPQDPDTAAEQILRRAEAGAIESQVRDANRDRAAQHEQDTRDDQVLIVLHRLEAEVRRLKTEALRPRNGFLRLAIRDLETNPHAQFGVHKWGMWYWVVNFPLVTALFFLEPSVWLKWGLYITLIYSIYANFATDYGAMSAAIAAFEDRSLPPIPGVPFSGGRGGQGGTGGAGGSGGAGRDGSPGEPGAPGSAGEPGEEGEPGQTSPEPPGN